jgi:rod shape-determining protein MreC
MLLSRRARETILSVLLLAVPVVLLYGNLGQPQDLNPVDRAVLRVAGGLQWGVTFVTRGGVDAYDRYLALWQLEASSERLRRENATLRENNGILTAWAQGSQRLERELGFQPTPDLKMIPAEVVGRGVSPFFEVLRVRQLRPGPPPHVGQPVVVPEGLVGRVRRVYGAYADVLLVDDVESRVKVVVQPGGAEGELRGQGRGDRLVGRIEYLTARDLVRPGDAVYTSGMGGDYPADLRVGTVSHVSLAAAAGHQRVTVRPVVTPRGLDRVHFVVRRRWKNAPPARSPTVVRRAP